MSTREYLAERAPSISAIKAWAIVGLGGLFYCYEYFLRVTPSMMTNELMQAYQLDAAMLGHLAAFYYYAYTPMQLPVGLLIDHYGPRRLLIFACLICVMGTLLFAISDRLLLAQMGRFLVGLGSAFGFVSVLKLATLWLPIRRFAMIAGLATTAGMIAAIIGDNAMALLVHWTGWRNTAYISAILGVALAALIAALMPDSYQKPSQSQWVELKQLLKGTYQFIKDYRIWLNGIIGCILYLPLSAFAELWGVPYLQNVMHYSASEAASTISAVFLGWAIGGPIAGRISDVTENRLLPMLLGAVSCGAIISIILAFPTVSHLTLSVLLFLFGFSSSAQVIVFAFCRDLSPFKLSGTALALTNMIVMLGAIISQPAIGMLLDWVGGRPGISKLSLSYSVSDYQFALSILPLSMAIACILLGILWWSERQIKASTQLEPVADLN